MSAPEPPLLLDLFQATGHHHHTTQMSSFPGANDHSGSSTIGSMPVHDQGASYFAAVGRAQRLEAALRQIIWEEVQRALEDAS